MSRIHTVSSNAAVGQKWTSIACAIGIAVGLLGTAPASAYTVSVSADFTSLQVVSWSQYGALTPQEIQNSGLLSVNGQTFDPCAGDSTCVTASNTDSSAIVTTTGSSIRFGYDPAKSPTARVNSLSFAPGAAVDETVASTTGFNFGTLTYTNGQFWHEAIIGVTLTATSDDPLFGNHTLYGKFDLVSTNPLSSDRDPVHNADTFTFSAISGGTVSGVPTGASFEYNICPAGDPSAPACNTGSVDIQGHLASLDVDGFTNPQGGSVILSGQYTPPTTNPVPEPATLSLFGMGLAAIGAVRRRPSWAR